MNRKRDLIKNPYKVFVKDSSVGQFIFHEYPDGVNEFIQSGKYKEVKRMALEYFNATSSSNYMTVALKAFIPDSELESKFKNKDLNFDAEMKKLKRIFNKNK